MKKSKIVKEWNIVYQIHDGMGGLEEFFVILPTFRKVLWWFVTRGRKAGPDRHLDQRPV